MLVFFGKYEKGGNARVTLKANLTGEDKTYTTDFLFPDLDGDKPELNRLWALAVIEKIEALERIGTMPVSESQSGLDCALYSLLMVLFIKREIRSRSWIRCVFGQAKTLLNGKACNSVTTPVSS